MKRGLVLAGWAMAAVVVATGCGGGGGDPLPPPGGSHRLSVNLSGTGTVSSVPAGVSCASSCVVEFVAATTVTLTAAPAVGQVFSAWGGDCTGTAPTCTVALDRDRAVTAAFVPAGAGTFALGVSIVGDGSVTSQPSGINCGSGCAASFSSGATVTLTAVAAAGQVFSGWTGDCSGGTATCTLAMTLARTATATFASAPSAGGWTDELLLPSSGAAMPKVAIDSSGRVIVVWRQLDANSSSESLWSSRYVAALGWSAPELLENDAASVTDIHLAMDPPSGRAMVMWHQLTTLGAYDLWARAFDPAAGWGSAARVEAGTKTVGVSSVGIDAGGNAVAVWSQIEDRSSTFSIYANRFTASGGWGTAVLIETNGGVGNLDTDPIVAVAPSGDAVAVWKRSASGGPLWTNRFTVAGGWGIATELVRDEGQDQLIGAHDLALDANGNGLLVWGQADLGTGTWDSTIWFKRFNGGAWDAVRTRVTAPVQSAQGLISTPVLRLNAAGTALVAWGREDNSLVAALASAGAAFGPAATVRGAASRGLTSLPSMGLDDAGNALQAWTHVSDSGTTDLYVSRLSAGGGWSAPAVHENHPGSAATPSLQMNARGNASLVWQQYVSDQGTRIAVRHFVSGR